MRPAMMVPDKRYERAGHAMPCSKYPKRHAFGVANISHLIGSQFRRAVSFSVQPDDVRTPNADLVRVYEVTAFRHPFKIVRRVVRFIAVTVVRLMAGRAWAVEGNRDEKMHAMRSLFSVLGEDYIAVAPSRAPGPKNVSDACSGRAADTAHHAGGGNLIPALIANDRKPSHGFTLPRLRARKQNGGSL